MIAHHAVPPKGEMEQFRRVTGFQYADHLICIRVCWKYTLMCRI